MQQISRELQGVEVVGYARAVRGDIDAAVKATQDALRRRLHLFISSSDIHMDFQLRKTREEVLNIARTMVAYGKQFVDKIEFSPMDSTRSGMEFVIELVEAVVAEGATIINLPDTMGYALPEEYCDLFRTVRSQARGGDTVLYSTHCHNDPGLAVANSLAAIRAGATQIEVTVNGSVEAEFEDLELHSLSTGEDAHGEAVVTVLYGGMRYRGTSVHRDIILAAAQAYVGACNQAMLSGEVVGLEANETSAARNGRTGWIDVAV